MTNIRSFIALVGYYQRFIKDFSKIAKPLFDLTKKDVKFEWGPAQEESFEILKQRLCEAQILQFPDINKKFTPTTDASDDAVGAVLSQEKDEFNHPVVYLLRNLTKSELNYSTTEKECGSTACS